MHTMSSYSLLNNLCRWGCAVLVGVSGWVCPSADAQDDSPYVRVVDQDDGTIELDVAVRYLVPEEPAKPTVSLVGAVHIADPSFYHAMQSILDVHDVVLFEGVGSHGDHADESSPISDDDRAATQTRYRLAFLKVLADSLTHASGDAVTSNDDLLDRVDGPVQRFVKHSLVDGWGRAIRFDADANSFESLGKDGKPGGDELDADITSSEAIESYYDEKPDYAGLQRDLAKALGLVFQLDSIDYSHRHWRNSDMDVDAIRQALGAASGEDEQGTDRSKTQSNGAGSLPDDASDTLKAADALFNTLSGDSFMAKLSTFFLKMIGSNPGGRALVKIMLAQTLSQADALLLAQPGPIGDLMDVIIKDRNQAVIDDLQRVINDEPDVHTVAIFYGAGHFGDLEKRIEDDLGYHYDSTIWVPAITIDLDEAGISPTQVKMFRKMISHMLTSQMQAAKAMQSKE